MSKFIAPLRKKSALTVWDLRCLELGQLAHLRILKGLVEHGLGSLDIRGVLKRDGGSRGQDAGEDL